VSRSPRKTNCSDAEGGEHSGAEGALAAAPVTFDLGLISILLHYDIPPMS
jgi:hypothetical protein